MELLGWFIAGLRLGPLVSPLARWDFPVPRTIKRGCRASMRGVKKYLYLDIRVVFFPHCVGLILQNPISD
jgi:hypothetical protein